MEAAPPSYEKATLKNHLDLVAKYIPSNDLCSAALVCSEWHAVFTPHLWGNPASHFGIENDSVYVALTKFRFTLQIARPYVRSLTHTLHLPPAHAELYNGPHAEWLRDMLDRLPNLQSLIVRGLPFFDHSALQALKYQRPKDSDYDGMPAGVVEMPGSVGMSFAPPGGFIPSFGLRLLDASRCPNVTSSALAQALSRFESLLYIDLSFTYPARDPSVLRTFRKFSGLQVLKLRGISLTDEALGVLAPSIARRVRSLDIRKNAISDRGVRTLLDECFTINEQGSQSASARSRSPGLLPYMGADMLEIYQSENFEGFLRNTFTNSFVTRQAFEDAPEGGITHLYIAKNKVSAEGAAGLIRSGRLHVLDLEGVTSKLGRHLSNSGYDDSHMSIDMPGVEKLTPIVSKCAAEAMTFLRIDHRLVTKNAPRSQQDQADQIVQGRVELDDTAPPPLVNGSIEIDSTPIRPDAVELPTAQTPKYELPGDPLAVVVSPAENGGQQKTEDETGDAAGPRRGSVFAPEVVTNESRPTEHMLRRGSACAPETVDSLRAETDRMNLLSPVSATEEGTGTFSTMAVSPLSPTGVASAPSSPVTTSPTMRPRSYSSVANERRARLNAHVSSHQSLHPAMLPHVRELVLTDVPPYSHDQELSNRLITFIKQCAEEASLAKKQAMVDYALPPGRKHLASALRHSADKVFALRRLVLELATEESVRRSSKASPWQSANTKSMTDDRDSESLWAAAETDFSFFGDEDYSFPSLDPGRFAHSQSGNGPRNSFGGHSPPGRAPKPPPSPPAPRFDTVALLSAFRKERKAAHQRHVQYGAGDPETEGFWDGVVSVVRPGSGLRYDEEIDYYGNRFQKGYLYP